MTVVYYTLFSLLALSSVFPRIPGQHWTIRIFDFVKVQVFFLQSTWFILAWFLVPHSPWFYTGQSILGAIMLIEASILVQYTPLYKTRLPRKSSHSSLPVTFLSANVYQFNKQYDHFIRLVREKQPDVFFTMESNGDWEKALSVFDQEYPYHHKIALENTYGMHLYSRLKMTDVYEHYFVADDIPSIECKLETTDGYSLGFFGVHPPPPSPTEEENSRERDGELLSVAKKIRKEYKTCIAVGDFNNVAWGRSSVLFRKTSRLIDPRLGRGLLSTFHARYPLFRFPIDHIFHSTDIFLTHISVLENFGSDHLPLYFRFCIDPGNPEQENKTEDLEKGEIQEVDSMIKDGKTENGDRDPVATE